MGSRLPSQLELKKAFNALTLAYAYLSDDIRVQLESELAHECLNVGVSGSFIPKLQIGLLKLDRDSVRLIDSIVISQERDKLIPLPLFVNVATFLVNFYWVYADYMNESINERIEPGVKESEALLDEYALWQSHNEFVMSVDSITSRYVEG